MSLFARLRNLVHPGRHGRELDRELDFHIAEVADDLVAHGMERAEAERQARIRFGHRDGLREDTRAIGIVGWVETLGGDLRYALRGLRGNPAFTATVVLSLALGIGANTAIFSLLNAVLFKTLPVSHPEELVQVTMNDPDNNTFTNPLWEEIHRRQDVFANAFAFSPESFNLADGGEARKVDGNFVSGEYFQTLGLSPAAGRLISRGDDFRGCAPVAVLGHAFWQRQFAGDRSAIGRSLVVEGHPYQIIGVAPAGFYGVEVGRESQVYLPLCTEPILRGNRSFLDERSAWWLQVMARPSAGVTALQLKGRLEAMSAPTFAATPPDGWEPDGLKQYLATILKPQPAATGFSSLRARYQPALTMLMAVVALVLLIACGNVANLLLARATVRTRETAMRLALGASRGRLLRQMLTESLLLSLLGAGAGFLFARWSSALLVRLLADGGNVVWLDLTLDTRLLAFTIAVAVVTGLLFGLAPAWRSSQVNPQLALHARTRGGLEGGRRLTLGKVLVLVQVALSVVLLLGAALLLRTFHTLATLDPGFRREGLLAVRMELQGPEYDSPRLSLAQNRVLEGLKVIPGVRSAAAVDLLPISGMRWNGGIQIPGKPVAQDFRDRVSWFNRVTPGYFGTMDESLISGRDFGPHDVAGTVNVAIVSQAMVRKFFEGADPIGKEFIGEGRFGQTPYTVIGVVSDSRYRSLRTEPEPIVYLPHDQAPEQSMGITYLLRSDGPPLDLIPQIRDAVAQVDKRATFTALTVSESLDRSIARERLLATLSGFFGALALILALIGQYGLMSYSVARRRNEIGIRLALGAERVGVVQMVLGEVGRLVAIGVVVGLAGAIAAGRLVTSFLYGVTPTDPATLLATTLGVIAVGLAAGALPAWRAARLDPVAALRED